MDLGLLGDDIDTCNLRFHSTVIEFHGWTDYSFAVCFQPAATLLRSVDTRLCFDDLLQRFLYWLLPTGHENY